MNIMELGALGEFVGSIGVIVTLAYVAVQIRQNTQSVRVNNQRIETDRNIAHTRFAIATPGLMSIYRRGQKLTSRLTNTLFLLRTFIQWSWISRSGTCYRSKRDYVSARLVPATIGSFKLAAEEAGNGGTEVMTN